MGVKSITVNQYLARRRKELGELQKVVNFLEGLRGKEVKAIPNSIGNGARLFSQDYGMANFVSISSIRGDSSSFNTPDGGISDWKVIYFPRFIYRQSKNIEVKISNENEGPDFPEAVICTIHRVEGTKMYSEDSRAPVVRYPNEIDGVVERYRELGVEDRLLMSLRRKARRVIKDIGRYL